VAVGRTSGDSSGRALGAWRRGSRRTCNADGDVSANRLDDLREDLSQVWREIGRRDSRRALTADEKSTRHSRERNPNRACRVNRNALRICRGAADAVPLQPTGRDADSTRSGFNYDHRLHVRFDSSSSAVIEHYFGQ
jgi:hypothetical protein